MPTVPLLEVVAVLDDEEDEEAVAVDEEAAVLEVAALPVEAPLEVLACPVEEVAAELCPELLAALWEPDALLPCVVVE